MSIPTRVRPRGRVRSERCGSANRRRGRWYAASRAAVDTAVRLGRELGAPLVFVYVRRGPAGFWGSPVYQRRLTAEMTRARRALDTALAAAERAGVDAEGEILEGTPRRRILEFADDRGARLVVVGTRGRRLRRSVSTSISRVVRTACRRGPTIDNAGEYIRRRGVGSPPEAALTEVPRQRADLRHRAGKAGRVDDPVVWIDEAP